MRKLSTALLCSVLGLVGILQIHGQTVPPKQTELRLYVGPIEGTDKALAEYVDCQDH
jgi:hypothetical protein